MMGKRYLATFIGSACLLAAVACGEDETEGEPDGGSDDVVEDTSGMDTGGDFDTGMADATDTGPSGDVTDTDPSGDATDVGDTDDAGPSVPPTNFYYFTSGGGTLSSGSHELRLSVGAPSPRGEASNDNHRLRLAPVSP